MAVVERVILGLERRRGGRREEEEREKRRGLARW
jgi:hypothetical protein